MGYPDGTLPFDIAVEYQRFAEQAGLLSLHDILFEEKLESKYGGISIPTDLVFPSVIAAFSADMDNSNGACEAFE